MYHPPESTLGLLFLSNTPTPSPEAQEEPWPTTALFTDAQGNFEPNSPCQLSPTDERMFGVSPAKALASPFQENLRALDDPILT